MFRTPNLIASINPVITQYLMRCLISHALFLFPLTLVRRRVGAFTLLKTKGGFQTRLPEDSTSLNKIYYKVLYILLIYAIY